MSLKSFIFLSLLLSACTAVPTYTNKWKVDAEYRSDFPTGVDANNKIRWTSYNDNDNLYVSIESGFKPTQIKMLKQGVTLFFDSTQKKKEDIFIKYPANLVDNNISRSEYKSNALTTPYKVIDKIPSTISFRGINGHNLIDRNQESNVNVQVEFDSIAGLSYHFSIPLTELGIVNMERQSEVMMGIKCNGMPIPSTPPSTQGRGPGGKGGRGGKPSGTTPRPPAINSDLIRPIEFWVKIQFASL